jgi:hypothetical protein
MKRNFSELSNLAEELEIATSKKYIREDVIKTYCRIKSGGSII